MGQLAAAILIIAALEADPAQVQRPEPTETLTIRLVRPDRQLEALLALFQGTRARHPPAALAAWRRAHPGARGLGKSLEAAIAALNPGMVRELRSLDDARLALGLDQADGQVRWYAVAPHDDGSFGGLATALALTDGGQDDPFQGLAIDRLGPPGAPIRALTPGALTLAASRIDLPWALRQAQARDAADPGAESGGLRLRLEARSRPRAGPLSTLRVVEALLAAGCRGVDGSLVLKDETLELTATARLEADAQAATPVIDPGWLDWAAAEGLSAAVAIAIDPGPRTWDDLFAWVDRIERVDPARSQVAPVRTRMNLTAAAAGVRPEIDLLPRLRGLSAFAHADDAGDVQRLVVALHVSDAAAAKDIATRFLPRALARLVGRTKPVEPAEGIQPLGRLSGRPLELAHRDATVLIGWGDSALASALAAKDDTARSAGPAIRASWGGTPPQRLGAVWPGRLGSPLLSDAPPVLWIGRNDGTVLHDVVRWTGLRGVVRRGLERLDIEPERAP